MTLKELRKLHGLTEQAMAERMGMSRAGLQKIERGAHTSTYSLLVYATELGFDFGTVASAWALAHATKNKAYPK